MADDPPLQTALPLILIRGFGGLSVEDEKRIAYQGFNDGTVYPGKRGDNYIYEGLVLRFLKSNWRYQDATNVVGYHNRPITTTSNLPPELASLDAGYFSGHKIVVDPAMALQLLGLEDPMRTLWVFRYYDLDDREFPRYGEALVRIIDLVRDLAAKKGESKPKVNIIAHSMGGLIVREAVQVTYPKQKGEPRAAEKYINKIVTLGTPHKGIVFQRIQSWLALKAASELRRFDPEFQKKADQPAAYINFHKHFPLNRLLTVVGTNYRSYSVAPAIWLNRLVPVEGEFGLNYNRSDGLVKQDSAQIEGAPRTFVHKCHGGNDSLVTSREAFEIATRFFFGNIKARLSLVKAQIKRGKDLFGKSEFFLGVSIKPRGLDFDLFHQSKEAENCYGPFSSSELNDPKVTFPFLDNQKTIWEGFLDASKVMPDKSGQKGQVVFRLAFYLGERDLLGIGFSDNLIFGEQYYLRYDMQANKLYLHNNERFQEGDPGYALSPSAGGWNFEVTSAGFDGTFRVELSGQGAQ